MWRVWIVLIQASWVLGNLRRHEYLEYRLEDQYICDESSSRPTIYGAGMAEHDINPLKPNNILGDRIFDIKMTVSTDCARWTPTGYNVENTRRASNGIQTIRTSSLSSSAQSKSMSFGMGVGLVIAKISVSANYEKGTSTSSEAVQSEKKEYFVSYIESVDNVFHFSEAHPPKLSPGFLNLMQRYESDFDGVVSVVIQRQFLWDMFAKYSHFAVDLELGSRFMEVRSISETQLKNALRENNNMNAEAAVSGAFKAASFHAGGGYGNEQGTESITETLNRYSETFRTITGNNPDFKQMTFPTATSPGILNAKLRPVCDVLPVHRRDKIRQLRAACYDFVQSDLYCFSALPHIDFLDNDAQKIVEEHIMQLRTVGHCSNLLPPLFNYRIPFVRGETMHLSRSGARSLRDCIWQAYARNAVALSYLSRLGTDCVLVLRFDKSHTLKKYNHGSSVTIFLQEPPNASIFLLKKALVSGDFLKLKSKAVRVHSVPRCYFQNAVYHLSHSNTSTNQQVDVYVENWNTYMKQSLAQTFVDECEEECRLTESCKFIHKLYFVHWYTFGLTPLYYVDKHIRECGGIYPKVTIRCSLYSDVHAVNIVPDAAVVHNWEYGNLITSVLIRTKNWQKPALQNATLFLKTPSQERAEGAFSDVVEPYYSDEEKYGLRGF